LRKQLKDYIKENINIDGTDYREKDISDFKHWWSNIEKDCDHWLKEIRKNNPAKQLVYRGTSSPEDDFELIKVRKDRRPKDMSYNWHTSLDYVFKDKFGWKPRSEGLFVGTRNMASSYGKVFIVFPVGRYKYLWSEVHSDLYTYINDDYKSEPSSDDRRQWESDWEDTYGEGGDGEWYREGHSTRTNDKDDAVYDIIRSEVQDYEDALEELDKDDEENAEDIENLQNDIDRVNSSSYRNEIESQLEWEPSISLDSYIEEKTEDYSSDDFDVSDAAAEIIREAQYKTTDIIKGITKGKEVMLGCDKYYAISNEYKTLVDKFLFDPDFDPDQLSFDFNK
jgi:hypothetical protein